MNDLPRARVSRSGSVVCSNVSCGERFGVPWWDEDNGDYLVPEIGFIKDGDVWRMSARARRRLSEGHSLGSLFRREPHDRRFTMRDVILPIIVVCPAGHGPQLVDRHAILGADRAD